MIDHGVPYGFHSACQEIIFLREVQVNRVWIVVSSSTIHTTTTLQFQSSNAYGICHGVGGLLQLHMVEL